VIALLKLILVKYIFSCNFIIMVEQMIGSRAQVMNGTAHHTKGGLTKKGLMYNKHGRIVSKRKHNMGKKTIKHLYKLGYKPKKGSFKLFRKGHGKRHSKRGGMHALNPSPISGINNTSGVALQFMAGNATG
jgi:hypothetical protein